jgi:hypothetical protein
MFGYFIKVFPYSRISAKPGDVCGMLSFPNRVIKATEAMLMKP